MNVKFAKLAVLGAAFAVSAALTGTAHAVSVSGSVYEGQPGPNVLADPGGAPYALVPTDTFTLTNASATGLFNFYSANDGPGPVGGLASFLTTTPASTPNGDTLVLSNPATANDSINNDLFQFTGTVTLTDQTYTFLHDDGLLLYLNGMLVINDGSPTSAENTFFTVQTGGTASNSCTTGGSTCTFTGGPGTYTFTLDYAEVDGPPAELVTNLPLTSVITPEPSSLMLLGTGLVSAAGVFMRKRRTA
jgi:hypothetical protein